MGNLLSGSSTFLNKHDLAVNGTVMDITNIEYKNAEPNSAFKDQWIVTLRDTRTQADLGCIGLPAGTESRNKALQAIATSLELDGPYIGVIIKEIPSKTVGYSPFYALNDYQGSLDMLMQPTIESEVPLQLDMSNISDNHPF